MEKITALSFVALTLILFSSCQQGKNKLDSVDPFNDMVLIEGGEFSMGETTGSGTSLENPIHTVKISGFYLSKYEVTVNEYSVFTNETGYKTDANKKDSSLAFSNYVWKKVKGVSWRHDATGVLRSAQDYNHPVIHVSWNDANAYCQWLSNKTGRKYRLPTEAEWEFAARNRGQKIRFSWGNDYPNGKKAGNLADESLLKQAKDCNGWESLNDSFPYTSPVGSFNPNGLGLYDMTGNVWEWCSDWFDPNYYSTSPKENPSGPSAGTVKSFRGGCWFSDENYSRIAFHNFGNPPDQSYGDFGFRIAMTP